MEERVLRGGFAGRRYAVSIALIEEALLAQAVGIWILAQLNQ